MRQISVLALALATLFVSCAKETADNCDKTIPEGGAAAFRIAITLPQTLTRATENATAKESAVNDVHIYLFNPDGSTPADANNGYFGPFDLGQDFTKQGTRDTYNMKNAVTTTSGTKNIYVGVNLTAAGLGGGYASEAAFLAKTADVHGKLIQYKNSELEGIAMFGAEYGKVLKPAVDGDNVADIDIERAVARVIATSAGSSFTKTWATSGDMKFEVTKYFVTQDAYRSFAAPNVYADGKPRTLISQTAQADWGNVLNMYDPADYIGRAKPYVAISSDPGAGGRSGLNGFYIGENVTDGHLNVPRQGNTPYAFVQTKVSISRTANVKSDRSGIEYKGGAVTGGVSDLYLVRVLGVVDYICAGDNWADVESFLKTGNPEAVVNTYKYPKAYVYYRVFLNKTENGGDKYNVYRNQFIHIAITGINVSMNQPGGFGNGYPGGDVDPEVPVDPFQPDPNNPNPEEPGDPIDEEEASLLVNITAKPWTYVSNQVILQ